MEKKVYLVKAFTTNPQGGNPAGVMLGSEGLREEQMIGVAAKLGFSESAFVLPSRKGDFRVRFFTPQAEVPLCGHATIATAHVLVKEGLVSSEYGQETGAGVIKIDIEPEGKIMMQQKEPSFGEPEENRAEVARLLGIEEQDLMAYPVQQVATGARTKLVVPVKSLQVLQAIKPNLAGIRSYDMAHDNSGFYPFTAEVLETGSDFHARQFNPLVGIDEDPITGVAAGPLACYAREHGLVAKDELVIEQGYVMGKGGKMYVEVREGVRVGGYAVVYDEVEMGVE